MGETELGAMARTYVNTGWAVFPLWWPLSGGGGCACPAGSDCASPAKHPLVGRGVHDASRDLDQVAAWWQQWPQANIGLPAGGNDLAILDIDPRHDGLASFARLVELLHEKGWGSIPSTLTSVTGSGGLHLVFEAPAGGVKNGSRVFGVDMPGVDSRGRGGYIVAPPSRHASGGTYRWLNFFHEVAAWPAVLSELMDPPQPKPPAMDTAQGKDSTRVGEPYIAAALDDELARVASAQEGSRNETLHVAAFRLGQLAAAAAPGSVRVEDIEAHLCDAGVSTGLRLTETRATVRSGLRAGIERPRRLEASWPT